MQGGDGKAIAHPVRIGEYGYSPSTLAGGGGYSPSTLTNATFVSRVDGMYAMVLSAS